MHTCMAAIWQPKVPPLCKGEWARTFGCVCRSKRPFMGWGCHLNPNWRTLFQPRAHFSPSDLSPRHSKGLLRQRGMRLANRGVLEKVENSECFLFAVTQVSLLRRCKSLSYTVAHDLRLMCSVTVNCLSNISFQHGSHLLSHEFKCRPVFPSQ